MWLLIVSSLLALLTGISNQVTDLFSFKNDSDKERFKNKFKWIAFVIFLITSGFSAFQLLHNYKESDKDRIHADSLLRATKKDDSIKSDSLFRDNKDLKDSLLHVNTNLRNLENLNTKLLLSQTANFVNTAKKIQNSADTLNKYIAGIEGFCYLVLNSMNSGDYFFSIVNPNKYSLRNVRVYTNKYSDLDSCTEWRGGVKFINIDKTMRKSIMTLNDQVLAPGESTEIVQVNLVNGWKQKFLIRIEIGSSVYYEELIISLTDGCIGYKVYSAKADQSLIINKQHKDKCLFNFDWNTEFHFKINDLKLSRGNG
ncbi:MAG TPA: hypothetical protein VNX40_04355 [Mucilaginibacter sp.]|jgi:hypothetical protein|nr:hypothetical protein [Mucilaginibacter sp.]